MDTDLNAHNDEQLQQEEVDDSCRLQFTEIVPLTTDTQCVSGDWSADAEQENFSVVKQEPSDVCVLFMLDLI